MHLKPTTLVLVLVAFGIVSPAGYTQQGPTKGKKWEYAELVAWHSGSVRFGADALQFSIGKTRIEADCWQSLAKKLRIPEKDASALAVIEYLGSEGWEMSGTMSIVTGMDRPLIELRWYFKRERQ